MEAHPLKASPTLGSLETSMVHTDAWYVSHASQLDDSAFEERIVFTFMDGKRGCMTRSEILMHVALHSALHRGEVYRLLQGRNIDLPWDTFAVFLHQSEPARRTASDGT